MDARTRCIYARPAVKVAIDVTSALKPGGTGIAQYVRSLVPAIAAIDRESAYYLVWRLSRLRHRGLVPVPARNFARRLLVGKGLCRLPPDVAVYHACGTRLPRLRNEGVRLIPTLHDILSFVSGDFSSQEYRAMKAERFRDAAARAFRVLTVSEFSKSEIVRHLGVPPERVTVIPNGVDARFRPHGPAETAPALARLGLGGGDGGRPYVLFVGLMTERKNVVGLIEAFERALPRLPKDLDLVLAGRPKWGKEAIERALERPALRGRARRIGFVAFEDLPLLYAAARLFVLPSFYEGFGIPVLEAMASGVPVVASSAAAIPEVAGDAAPLVDPRDPAALADALVEASTDEGLRARLVERGLTRAREFTWERTARMTLDLYREAAGPR